MLSRLSSRFLHRSLTPLLTSSSAQTSLWQHVYNLDATHCHDTLVSEYDLQIQLDVITEDEEKVLSDECSRILRRRRYEEDHWDHVIIKFKEMERSRWSSETERILQKVRETAILPQKITYFPAVHVIELAEDGYIKPHVDSIKFSGRVVAGISLLSPSIMRFKEEHGDSVIDAYLQRRSMYMVTGRIRYHYTHEILPGAQLFRQEVLVKRTHRISIIFRDKHMEEHVAKYYTPFYTIASSAVSIQRASLYNKAQRSPPAVRVPIHSNEHRRIARNAGDTFRWIRKAAA